MVIRIELVPTLDHCIETVARQEFLKSAGEYMQSGEANKKLEDKIQLLRAFLDTADFRKLRSESEKHLIEGNVVKFIIYLKSGKAEYELIVKRRYEKDSIIYGPVSSWRLGRSLGIDILSAGSKTCSFDCIYCEWGPTRQPPYPAKGICSAYGVGKRSGKSERVLRQLCHTRR